MYSRNLGRSIQGDFAFGGTNDSHAYESTKYKSSPIWVLVVIWFWVTHLAEVCRLPLQMPAELRMGSVAELSISEYLAFSGMGSSYMTPLLGDLNIRRCTIST